MSEPKPEFGTTANVRRRPLFLFGFLLFVLGPVLNFVQLRVGQLWTPWYVPVLASVGVLLMIASLRQRRSVLRLVGLVVFVVVCGLEWYLFAVKLKAPEYSGP